MGVNRNKNKKKISFDIDENDLAGITTTDQDGNSDKNLRRSNRVKTTVEIFQPTDFKKGTKNKEWVINKIVDGPKDINGHTHYRVSWDGYLKTTWEPETELKDTTALKDFKAKKKGELISNAAAMRETGQDPENSWTSAEWNIILDKCGLLDNTITVNAISETNNQKDKLTEKELLVLLDQKKLKVSDLTNPVLGYNKAMRSPYKNIFSAAHQKELKKLGPDGYNAYEHVSRERVGKSNILRSTWVHVWKSTDGIVTRANARLCIMGNGSRPGIDYNPQTISSPVVKTSTLMAVLASAVNKGHNILSADHDAAYLNVVVPDSEDYFFYYPQGFPEEKKKGFCLRAKKCIYGLNISSAMWYDHLRKTLKKYVFVNHPYVDECLFTYRAYSLREEEKGSKFLIKDAMSEKRFRQGDSNIIKEEEVILAVHVDDDLITTSNMDLYGLLMNVITLECPIGAESTLDDMLGMHFEYNRKDGVLKIDQTAYIEKISEKFGIHTNRPVNNPMRSNQDFTTRKDISDAD